MQLTAIDLFAGGGGLTVGLKKAGFTVLEAVENNMQAANTYKLNHPEVKVFDSDIRLYTPKTIGSKTLDLIAGCPPCQGFTSLTSKYRREDARNALIEEMERVIVELQPRAVMMENVPGLAGKGKLRLSHFVEKLESLGYIVNVEVLQVADFGTPQCRRRLVLLAGKGFEILIPKATHDRLGRDGKKRWREARDILKMRKATKTFERGLIPRGRKLSDWHVVRKLSPENQERLKWIKPGGDWNDIPESLRVPCHRNGYQGFSNVYGRMAWHQTPPTMTAGCTTLSKGRFAHPVENRTISVLEAAKIQEFPTDYRLDTSQMDTACSIIGNALPCGFAKKMAEAVIAALNS